MYIYIYTYIICMYIYIGIHATSLPRPEICSAEAPQAPRMAFSSTTSGSPGSLESRDKADSQAWDWSEPGVMGTVLVYR